MEFGGLEMLEHGSLCWILTLVLFLVLPVPQKLNNPLI